MKSKRCEPTEVRKAGQVRELQRYVCKNCDYYFKFEKENKDLVLKLNRSGIRREDIEGIEYLDESKISFKYAESYWLFFRRTLLFLSYLRVRRKY